MFGCVPYSNPPAADIPKLATLKDVMDSNATIADPTWSKIGDESYSDADYATFLDVGTRIQALSDRAKTFSKGAEFDRYADQLKAKAADLAKAAEAKDRNLSSKALEEMKATCKACHSATR